MKKIPRMQRVRFELRIRNGDTFSIILSCNCLASVLSYICCIYSSAFQTRFFHGSNSINPGQTGLGPFCLQLSRASLKFVVVSTEAKWEKFGAERIINKSLLENQKADQMKKVNKQFLLDIPCTVRVSEKTKFWQVIVQQQPLVLKKRFQ